MRPLIQAQGFLNKERGQSQRASDRCSSKKSGKGQTTPECHRLHNQHAQGVCLQEIFCLMDRVAEVLQS